MPTTTPYLSLTLPDRGQVNWDGYVNGDLTILDASVAALSSSLGSSTQLARVVSLNSSTGAVVLTAGNNITLSQNASTISINAASQSIQTDNMVSVNSSTGNIILVGGNNITLSQNASTITFIGQTQSIQTQSTAAINGSTGLISLLGGSNVTLSQNASTITIVAAGQTVQTQSTAAINGSTGNISLIAGNNISLSQNASSITISASNQSVQTQNVVDVSLSGNTTGTLALISSGTMILAGGNNITLSQNGQSVTIVGNAGGGGNFTAGVSGGNTSGTSGTVNSEFILAGGNNITLSAGTAAGGVMSVTISGANQSIQTQSTVAVNGSTGNISFVAGANISLSQNASTITISGSNPPAQTVQTIGVYASSQTVGQSSSSTVDARSFTHVGQGIVSVGLSGGSLLISATTAAQSVQPIGTGTFGISNLGNTSGTTGVISGTSPQLILAGGNNVTLSQSINGSSATITVSAANQSVQTQNLVDVSLSGNTAGALALISSGTLILAGGNNVTLSQNGQSVTISGVNTIAQTNQTLGLYGSSQTVGQSSSTTADARSLTLVGQGALSVGMSGGSVLLSVQPGAQSNQTVGLYASSQTVGQSSSSTADARSISIAGQGIVSVGLSGGSFLISATTAQSVQTQNLHVDVIAGNTAGATASISSGTMTLAGGNNITLSQNGNAITISAANTVAQTVQSLGIYASSQTVGQSSSTTLDARSVSIVGQGIISVGASGGSILLSATTAAQTNQTLSFALTGNTTGNTSGMSVDARSLTIQGTGIASVGLSTSAGGSTLIVSATQSVQTQNLVSVNGSVGALSISGGNNITVGNNASTITISANNEMPVGISNIGNTLGSSGLMTGQLVLAGGNNITLSQSTVAGQSATLTISAAAQSNQTVGVYASSQTVGQSSSTTVDARSLSLVGQGIVSVGASGGSILISASAAQTNQTVGIYASSQTVGQSSSSTIDARSFTHVGQGIVSVGMSGGSLLISATTAQSVQTQNLHVDVIGGNTAGATASISSGTMTLAGGNNITLSQAGNAITISGANTVAQTNQTLSWAVTGNTNGNTSGLSVDARSLTLQGAGIVTAGLSTSAGGSSIIISATTAAQTNQTVGIYASSQTVGQSSSTTVDARSLSLVGQGIVSVGASAGSVLLSATQSVQTLGLYGVSNTTGATSSTTVDARSFSIAGQGIVSVGMSNGSVVISAGAVGGGSFSAGVSTGGNTSGNTAIVASQLVLAGGNNITLSQSVNGNSATVTVSAFNQSVQTLGFYASSQTVGQSSSSTVDARSVTVVGQGIISAGLSAGSLLLSATTVQTNQTLSLAMTGNTAGNSSAVTVDARSLTLQGLGIASVGVSTSAGGTSVLVSASQTVQTQNLHVDVIAGNTAGATASISSGTMTLAGGNNITLSQAGNAITISGPNTAAQSVQSLGFYASSQTVGQSSSTTVDARSVTLVGQGIVSVGASGGSLLISATTAQSVQTQNVVDVSLSGNTAGALALVSSGTVIFAGGNNITLSQNAQSITISGANTVAQTNQTLSLAMTGNTTGNTSGMTVDARSLTIQGLGLASVGLSTSAGGSSLIVSATSAAQTNQTVGIYASSQTVGQSSSTTVDARSLTLVGQGIVSVGASAGSVLISASAAQTVQTQGFSNTLGMSNLGNTSGTTGAVSGTGLQLFFAGGNNVTLSQSLNGSSGTITISAANQTNQSLSYAVTGNTTGNTSGLSVDARSLTLQGLGIISAGLSTSAGGSSIIISATTPSQTAQTVGVYASSQTVGQSSSSTVDARSFTHVGQGIVSVGLSGGSLLISATQSVQTQNVVDVSLSGNTAGALALISSGTMILAGGNNITLSQNGQSVTISGVNTVAQTNQTIGIYGSSQTVGQSSSSTVDARSLSLVGQGIVSVGMSGGSVLLSATTAAQTAQTVGVYASSQTVGQSSSSTVDARSLSIAGQGIVSVGMSGGSFLISATTPSQTNQTLSYAVTGNTTGNTSGLSVDARSLTLQGLGIVSAGLSTSAGGSSIIVSATTAAQTVQTIGLYASSQTVGQSSSSTVDARSLTIVGEGNVSVGLSAGSLLISATGGGGPGAAFSAGVSTGGNTAGNTGTVTNQVIFAGGNNITLSQDTGAGGATVTISAFNQSVQSLGIYAFTQTVGQSSSSTVDARSLSIVAQGNVYAGWNGGSFLISGFQSVQTQNLVDMSLIGANTTGTLALISSGTMFLAGGSNITISQNTQSITIIGPSISTAQLFISGNTAGATQALSSGSIVFAGGNNITLSQNANTVTISGGGGGGGFTGGLSNIGNTAGNTGTISSGQLIFAGGNNVTLSGSTNGSSMTITVSAFNQSVQTQGFLDAVVPLGNTTGTTASITALSWGLAGGANITLSQSTGAAATNLSIIGPTPGSLNFNAGLNITLSSTTAANATTLTISGAPEMPVGISNIGNTLGSSGLMTGQLVLAGGNNITLSQSTVAGQSATLTISAASQSVQSLGIYGSSQTVGQSSSSTVDARSLSVVGQGNISVGMSAGSLLISGSGGGGGFTGGLSNVGNTAGNTGTISSGRLIFAGANNITLSGSTNGSSMTISVSAPNFATAAAAMGAGMSNLGNTTGTSGTVTGQLVLVGGTQVTLSGSVNAGSATVTINGPTPVTQLSTQNRQWGASTTTTPGNNSVWVVPFRLNNYLSASTLVQAMSFTGSVTSNQSNSAAMTIEVGLYTAPEANQTSFASIWDQTLSMSWNNSGTVGATYGVGGVTSSSASTGLLASSVWGFRLLTFAINSTLSPGLYCYAFRCSTATTGNSSLLRTACPVMDNPIPSAGGYMPGATNASIGVVDGGTWSATSAALPTSFGLTDIKQTNNVMLVVKIGAV